MKQSPYISLLLSPSLHLHKAIDIYSYVSVGSETDTRCQTSAQQPQYLSSG